MGTCDGLTVGFYYKDGFYRSTEETKDLSLSGIEGVRVGVPLRAYVEWVLYCELYNLPISCKRLEELSEENLLTTRVKEVVGDLTLYHGSVDTIVDINYGGVIARTVFVGRCVDVYSIDRKYKVIVDGNKIFNINRSEVERIYGN